jgi:hypothetical protein
MQIQQSRKILMGFFLMLVLMITTACGSGAVSQVDHTTTPSVIGRDVTYAELQRGNTPAGENFGNWVVQTSKGLIQDAYVRNNNQLGVVISSQVRPNEVRPLAKSITQGFQKNFPNQNLKVLIYGPDKQLILTAQYDPQSNQVKYS